jgi:hypothetical protein
MIDFEHNEVYFRIDPQVGSRSELRLPRDVYMELARQSTTLEELRVKLFMWKPVRVRAKAAAV